MTFSLLNLYYPFPVGGLEAVRRISKLRDILNRLNIEIIHKYV